MAQGRRRVPAALSGLQVPRVEDRHFGTGEVGDVASGDGQTVNLRRRQDETIGLAAPPAGGQPDPFERHLFRYGQDTIAVLVPHDLEPLFEFPRLRRPGRPDQFDTPFDFADRDDAYVDGLWIDGGQPSPWFGDTLVGIGKRVGIDQVLQNSTGRRLGSFERLFTSSYISSGHSGPESM